MDYWRKCLHHLANSLWIHLYCVHSRGIPIHCVYTPQYLTQIRNSLLRPARYDLILRHTQRCYILLMYSWIVNIQPVLNKFTIKKKIPYLRRLCLQNTWFEAIFFVFSLFEVYKTRYDHNTIFIHVFLLLIF